MVLVSAIPATFSHSAVVFGKFVGFLSFTTVAFPVVSIYVTGLKTGPIVSEPNIVSGFIGPMTSAIPFAIAACPSAVFIPPGALNESTVSLSAFKSASVGFHANKDSYTSYDIPNLSASACCSGVKGILYYSLL